MGRGLGKHVHVNTWPWSRAMEPGGRVGGGGACSLNFQLPKVPFLVRNVLFYVKHAPFKTRQDRQVQKGGGEVGDWSMPLHNLPCVMTFNAQKMYERFFFKSEEKDTFLRGSARVAMPPVERRAKTKKENWEKGQKQVDWSMPLNITSL